MPRSRVPRALLVLSLLVLGAEGCSGPGSRGASAEQPLVAPAEAPPLDPWHARRSPRAAQASASPDAAAPADRPRGFLATVRHDVAGAPRRLWRDGRASLWNRPLAIGLLSAGAYALAQEQFEDREAAYFRDHGFYSDSQSVAFRTLGNGFTLFGATAAWYTVAVVRGDEAGHADSKTMFSALTVTSVATLFLKAIIPDKRPDGTSFDFPSGHTSLSFAAATTLGELYGSRVGVPAEILAGLVALQRVDSGRHDSGSVLFGGVLGYLVAHEIAGGRRPEVLGLEVGLALDPVRGGIGLGLSATR